MAHLLISVCYLLSTKLVHVEDPIMILLLLFFMFPLDFNLHFFSINIHHVIYIWATLK